MSQDDLDTLEAGTVFDILTEAGNDSCDYEPVATQEDIDRFWR